MNKALNKALNKAIEQGIEQGVEKGARTNAIKNILTVLQTRFSDGNTQSVEQALEPIRDLELSLRTAYQGNAGTYL